MKRRIGWAVAGILLLATVIRTYFALIAPLEPDQVRSRGLFHQTLAVYNDEPAHRSIVEFWAREGYHPSRGIDPLKPLPIESGNVVSRTAEDFQPPLYYILGSWAYQFGRLVGVEESIIFARLLNVLFGVLLLYFLYLSCRLLLRATESIAALAFAALLLSQVRFTSLVSNDALLWVISSAFIYLILRQPGGAKVWYEKVALVLICIAGLWSKLLFLPMLLVIPAAWFLTPTSVRNRRFPWLALVIPLVCWIPWLYWNWNHWGSMLPISVGFGVPEAPFYGLKRIISTVLYAVRSFWSPFDEVWGGGSRPVLFLALGVVGLVAMILGIQEVCRRFIYIRDLIHPAKMRN